MKEITKIRPVDKKKSEIYLNDKLAFVLYKGELRLFDIHENAYLSEADYNKIVNEILPKRALLRCGHLLEKRDYTEKQLRDKLFQARYPAEAVEYAVNKVKGYGFVDDTRYAQRFIELNTGRYSINSIKTKLFQKGIDKEIINELLESLDGNDLKENEDELVKNLLKKRHYYDHISDNKDNKELVAKEKAKQFNYLMSKGFSSDIIRKNLNVSDD